MALFHSGDRTALSVTDDGGPCEPVVVDAGEWAESGRGLRTVALLADSWGWHGGDAGRTVTTVFNTESDPGGLLDEGGRGLVIVDAIAACRWHTTTAYDKTVHASVPMPLVALTAAEIAAIRAAVR